MKKRVAAMTLAGVVVALADTAFGSGYRIPEQSLNSVALSNAYVANTIGADTSYYNPANMSWQQEGWLTDAGITIIRLPSIRYEDNRTSPLLSFNGDSKDEYFALPQVHLVSPEYGRTRFGFSLTYPAGLSKRWQDGYAKMFAEEFTLKVVEFNPTVAWKLSDMLSFGLGFRALYADGKVKSNTDEFALAPAHISRDLEGDTTEYGYNVALTFKPNKQFTLAATYRSNVDLDIEGDDALLRNSTFDFEDTYKAFVSVPVPAVATIGASYTCGKTTFEFTYDKTYWDEYEKLDFNYDRPLHPYVAIFDLPKAKNWKNTDAFRIGVTHQINDQWTIMAAYAIDENPIPDETLLFELPDSDAQIYSAGVQYRWSDTLKLGVAYLYDHKDSRSVTNSDVNGTFSGSEAHLMTFGMQYFF